MFVDDCWRNVLENKTVILFKRRFVQAIIMRSCVETQYFNNAYAVRSRNTLYTAALGTRVPNDSRLIVTVDFEELHVHFVTWPSYTRNCRHYKSVRIECTQTVLVEIGLMWLESMRHSCFFIFQTRRFKRLFKPCKTSFSIFFETIFLLKIINFRKEFHFTPRLIRKLYSMNVSERQINYLVFKY